MRTQTQTIPGNKKPMPDWLFVLWAGGTALLSYSLAYALRKPFTAAEFEGLQVYGMDYKIAVSIIQLLGYVSAKLLGIKYISELRPEGRLKFIIGSAALSEISLIAFGVLPIPYNIVALYFNGLSLGCMWGVIFSFLEGRRTTDILASIMGVSMALSSGVAKSLGLYALNQLHVSEFWMPALIGAAAFPLLCFTGWMMTRFPRPTEADIASRSERVTLNGHQRWALFRRFMPLLILLFGANLLLTVQRDIKEDFIVCIIDVQTISSWAFAQIDSIATFVLLAVFALLATTYNHLKVLCMLLILSTFGMGTLAFLGATEGNEHIPTTIWLFLQSLCLDIAYLSFQTIFFERFIACFKIKGNVGFFIITIDFVGYLGTLGLLLFKEFCASHIDWASFYNHMSLFIGVACCLSFIASLIYMIYARKRKQGPLPEKAEQPETRKNEKENNIYLTTSAI
ncbi:hypothetical protein Bacsa_1525 [Phocaeicola salanitronis DSM 18170]|uniref:Transmembrane protein n=1 Tax=Phocaeicola salanitronis (strain DSM 18170 / JCM 13657 / CCUG 60908 / BL78) TaxID=667015 RepID=F0QZJ6_PHOSB|nr:DUF5690 family protein [Phocaeicola salanitronis]ADY36097.1 hypothetical protein Bacsa_1525 [Phocaeicola salanitronis DSM 18170]